MNQQRQLKKAKLSERQERRETIRRRALSLCRMIPPLIDSDLTELPDMDITGAADAMDQLVIQQAEIIRLDTKIAQLEEALYS